MKKLSADQLIPGGVSYEDFLPEIPVQIHFCKNRYIYILKDKLQAVDIYSGKISWELSLSALNLLLKHEKLTDLPKFPEIHFLQQNECCFWVLVQKKILFIDCQKQEITHSIPIKKSWKNFDFNEKKEVFAYTQGNGLYLLFLDGTTLSVFVDKNRGVTAGQAASRSEFGIQKGTFWSPNGTFLAFYRIDESAVKDYPLVRVEDPIASLQKIKYPMSGSSSQRVELILFDLEKKEHVILQAPDETDAYLTCVTWSPDEKNIYLAELNRLQKECRLKRYSSDSGMLEKILFIEKNNKYTEPQHPLFFPDDNPESFIWQSRRDGFNHLYFYNKDGKLLKQLTKGEWEVTELAGYSSETRQVVFLSTAASPLNRNAYAVHLENGFTSLLTPEDGTHQIVLSSKEAHFIDIFSSRNVAGEVFLRSLPNGEIARTIQTASNPYENYLMPEVETGFIEKEDQTKLYYRIIQPPKMDFRKKYPLVFYVYGGPHVQLVRNEWTDGTKGFEYLMANEGYVVFYIDPRGSAHRGKAFEDAIWRNIGKAQLEDYTVALEWIFKEKNYIDTHRVGVYGWSFGGFMATSLMLKTSGIFCAGVAGGAVIDWAFYEAMYTERYMETKAENPDGYKENNLRNYVKNLRGNLLLIHCDNDPVVLWQHTLSFLKSAIRSKKQVDYFVYPGYEHNVQGPDRVHLMLKIKTYFDEKIKR